MQMTIELKYKGANDYNWWYTKYFVSKDQDV